MLQDNTVTLRDGLFIFLRTQCQNMMNVNIFISSLFIVVCGKFTSVTLYFSFNIFVGPVITIQILNVRQSGSKLSTVLYLYNLYLHHRVTMILITTSGN